MKVKEFIQTKLDDIISPIIEYAVNQVVFLLFDRFFEKGPDHAEVAIVSLYPPVDVELEELVKKTEQEYDDAMDLQKTIQSKKQPRKKYRNSNHFLQTHLSYTFPLTGLSREEAIEHALQRSITGKEGFFTLVSNKDFSLHEALRFYREKDRLEKLFHSMKNEIHPCPTRCWTQEAVYGSILIVFLAQLVISMLRYKHASLRHVSTKIFHHAKPP